MHQDGFNLCWAIESRWKRNCPSLWSAETEVILWPKSFRFVDWDCYYYLPRYQGSRRIWKKNCRSEPWLRASSNTKESCSSTPLNRCMEMRWNKKLSLARRQRHFPPERHKPCDSFVLGIAAAETARATSWFRA